MPLQIACATEADCPATHDCVENPYDRCATDGSFACEPGDPPLICVQRATAAPAESTPAVAPIPGPTSDVASGSNASTELTALDAAGSETSAEAGACSLGTVQASSAWGGVVSSLGVAAAFRARRRRNGRTV